MDPEAEAEVIEAAYRRLARKYHPDVAAGSDSESRMVAINRAWEILRDPIRRSALDRARTTGASERVAAADASDRARGGANQTSGSRPASDSGEATEHRDRPGPAPGAAQRPPDWQIPGMRDPSENESADPRPDTVSRDWTSGRSTTGSTYDPATMQFAQGHGAAGPPPGRPSGSVLNFGRYAAWSLGEIARADIEYLEWLDRTPIGRMYQPEIDVLLRSAGRRRSAPAENTNKRGLFRRS